MESLLLLLAALDEYLHGDVPGENHEEGTVHRDEELRSAFQQAALSAAVHGDRSDPSFLLAW